MANNRAMRNQSTAVAYAKRIEQTKAAERMVCGALLLESDSIVRVADILKPGYFYDPAMEAVYRAISSLWQQGQRPDMLKVCEVLLKSGEIDKAGGMYEISRLASNVGSTANLEDHAYYIRECFLQRSLSNAGSKIKNIAEDLTLDVTEQLSQATTEMDKVTSIADNESYITTIKEATDKALSQYNERERLKSSGSTYGIMTGLKILDKYVNGFKPGELIVLGARPAMGKTSVMLNFAKNMAISGKKVCIFSLEMSDVSLANRVILSYCPGIDTSAFRSGNLSDGQKEQMIDAVGEARRLPLLIDETPNISMQQLRIRCMLLKRKKQLDCVMIDYLQLMNMRGENRQYNREQEIAQTTRQLKQMAKELEIPVVLLSQLNRNVDAKLKNGTKTTSIPGMSDLRESGAIEQDADVILLIHRPEYYGDTDAIKGVGIINIAKQRDGMTGKIEFVYNESLTIIGDARIIS